MTKILIDEAVVRAALKALIDYEEQCDWEWGSLRTIEQIDCDGETPESITALRQALADAALEKMADNARELGLDYE